MLGVLKGLWLTFRHQFRPRFTEENLEDLYLPPNFRGFLKLEGVVGEDPIPDRSEVTPPCAQGCPAHVDACGYINLTAQGKYLEGYRLHMLSNPLPATYGRICYAPCEKDCRRGGEDEEIQIRGIKRYMVDKVFEMFDKGEAEPPQGPPPKLLKDEKVAVIGSGPAGLACAYYLRQMGYEVTIYEKEAIPGGMLALGIPEYRLPREILNKEIEIIMNTGITLECGKAIGTDFSMDQLLGEMGYKAVFLGVGAHVPLKLGLPGDDLEGVIAGETFLRDIALGNPPNIGKRVIVVGAGNTAMDCTRVARRLGSEVHVVYRRSRKEAPAHQQEVTEAEEEGVEFEWLANPISVKGEDGRVSAVELQHTELGPPDERGRRSPMPVEGSEFIMEADTVITALSRKGSWTEEHGGKGWLEGTGIETDRRGITWDVLTNATSRPGVFGGGDATRGPGAAIVAIGDGHRAALAIDTWIQTGELQPQDIKPRVSVESKTKFHPRPLSAIGPEKLAPDERVKSFVEEELRYTDAQAKFESERCLSCMTRSCIGCASCANICPDKCISMEILQDDETRIIDEFNIQHDLCCYCGLCTEACPTKTLVHTTEHYYSSYDRGHLDFGRQKLLRTTCEKASAPEGMDRWVVRRNISKIAPGGGYLPTTLQGTHPGRDSVPPTKAPGKGSEFAYPAGWRQNEIERLEVDMNGKPELEEPKGSAGRLLDSQYPGE